MRLLAAARVVAGASLLIASDLGTGAALHAQASTRYASTHLDPDHWAIAAARRLAALGLAPPGFGWGERALTLREVERVLRTAADRARVVAPGHAALAQSQLDRFAEEFAATAPGDAGLHRDDATPASGALAAGFSHHQGMVLGGVGYNNEDDWTGAIPVGDVSAPFAAVALRMATHPRLALDVGAEYHERDIVITTAELSAAWGNLGAWIGRRRVGFGPGAGGGIVLTGTQALDGIGLRSLDAFTLPGPLEHLGPVRVQGAVSRIRNGDRIRDPWFWAARVACEPHARLQVGLTRAVMMGGKGNSAWTLRNVVYSLIGKHAGEVGEFDNQVVAVDLHLRPPLDALPLLLYLEWGLDDSAGAIMDVPAIVAGVFVPALPMLPAAAFRLEHTTFAGACCGNTIWYRNWSFRGGWTNDGVPLGHPLGGHGREWLAELRADLYDARLRLAGGALLRRRGYENLFAPERKGDAAGAWLHAALRPSSRFEAVVAGAIERGEAGWTEHAVELGVHWFLQ